MKLINYEPVNALFQQYDMEGTPFNLTIISLNQVPDAELYALDNTIKFLLKIYGNSPAFRVALNEFVRTISTDYGYISISVSQK